MGILLRGLFAGARSLFSKAGTLLKKPLIAGLAVLGFNVTATTTTKLVNAATIAAIVGGIVYVFVYKKK